MFQVVTASLGIPEGTVWVPFVVNKATWEYVIGTDPVKELFPPTPTPAEPEALETEIPEPIEEVVEAETSTGAEAAIINE
jgi:hypothetical protein